MPDPELDDAGDDDFRAAAHRAADWMADYLRDIERHPVLAQTAPGELRRSLPQTPPEDPQGIEEILADIDRLIVPATTHWNSPGFLAYFASSTSTPGIVGEMLSAAMNVNAMLWRTAPAGTELEVVTLDWLRQLLGLPEPLFGVINDTASSSTLYALAAAREALADLRIREEGMSGRPAVPQLRFYASEEAHSSVEKAGIVLGLGRKGLRRIPVDDAFRMDVQALEAAIVEDVRAGIRPMAVVATAGTTSTTSVDPVAAIADVCARHGTWLHVDAAYAGAAAIVPELRWVLDGAASADSLVVNPHKWLFTPIDCSVLWTRRPDTLRAAFSLTPEYLRSDEGDGGDVPNLMDYGVSLGRRFRALKLWMVLRQRGAAALRRRIRFHCTLASELAERVRGDARFELMAPVPLSVVCLRANAEGMTDADIDALNERILRRLNAEGTFFLSHTRVHDRYAIRVAFGNVRTQRAHADELWAQLQRALEVETASA